MTPDEIALDALREEIARLKAELDQALKVLEREKKDHRDFRNKMGGKIRHLNARAAAAAMDMRKRAAATYAMYSGVDLTKRLLSLPIDPDATEALNQMLNEEYKAGQRDMWKRVAANKLWAVQRIIRALPIKERNE